MSGVMVETSVISLIILTFNCKLELYINGFKVDETIIDKLPDINSGEMGNIDLPLDLDFGKDEASIIVNLITKKDESFAPAGRVVAYEQFTLRNKDLAPKEIKAYSTYTETDVEIIVNFGGCRAIIDKEDAETPLLNLIFYF